MRSLIDEIEEANTIQDWTRDVSARQQLALTHLDALLALARLGAEALHDATITSRFNSEVAIVTWVSEDLLKAAQRAVEAREGE